MGSFNPPPPVIVAPPLVCSMIYYTPLDQLDGLNRNTQDSLSPVLVIPKLYDKTGPNDFAHSPAGGGGGGDEGVVLRTRPISPCFEHHHYPKRGRTGHNVGRSNVVIHIWMNQTLNLIILSGAALLAAVIVTMFSESMPISTYVVRPALRPVVAPSCILIATTTLIPLSCSPYPHPSCSSLFLSMDCPSRFSLRNAL